MTYGSLPEPASFDTSSLYAVFFIVHTSQMMIAHIHARLLNGGLAWHAEYAEFKPNVESKRDNKGYKEKGLRKPSTQCFALQL